MDTSKRFTSPRLRAVKRENKIREGLTSREYAQLIFDEIEDIDQRIFDLLFQGNETGVGVDEGRRTISYRQLEMSVNEVLPICASSEPLIRDGRFVGDGGDGPRNHQWGILMVRHEDRQLIWVKAHELSTAKEVIALTPELLTELFEARYDEASKVQMPHWTANILYGSRVYGDLVTIVTRRANHYSFMADRLLVKATEMNESYRILNAPIRGW
jgi:hypothetical protein